MGGRRKFRNHFNKLSLDRSFAFYFVKITLLQRSVKCRQQKKQEPDVDDAQSIRMMLWGRDREVSIWSGKQSIEEFRVETTMLEYSKRSQDDRPVHHLATITFFVFIERWWAADSLWAAQIVRWARWRRIHGAARWGRLCIFLSGSWIVNKVPLLFHSKWRKLCTRYIQYTFGRCY